MTFWRWFTGMGSVAGIAGIAFIWSQLDDPGSGYLALCSLPVLAGLVTALARLTPQTRILLLWSAAGLSGLVAVLTLWSGAAFVLLAAMVLYLVAAWGTNEGSSSSVR